MELRTFSTKWLKLLRYLYPATPVQLVGTNVDWSSGDIFFKSISVDTTITFSNTYEGAPITITFKNTSVSNKTLTFPVGVYRHPTLDLVVEPNKENVYTFFKSNNKFYVSYIPKMVNT